MVDTYGCSGWYSNTEVKVTLISDRIRITIVRDDEDRPITREQLVLIQGTGRVSRSVAGIDEETYHVEISFTSLGRRGVSVH